MSVNAVTTATATLSPDRLYRYDLARYVGSPLGVPVRSCLFVMLNPSTADAELDDHTVTCCRRLAAREGCAIVHVVNLYAYRTFSPRVLVASWRAGVDVIGPETDEHLRAVLVRAGARPLVIAAWGARPAGLPPEFHAARVEAVRATVAEPLHCLGTTADGSPRHPSRLPRTVEVAPWPH